jgi:phosphatidylglycerophosphate synthase
LIRNFFLVTIAYVLILLLVAGYFAEDLMDNIHKMNLLGIGIGLIVLYLILLVLYSMLVYVLYTVKYRMAKKSVKRYYEQLGKITQLYVDDESSQKRTGRRR